ncbi:MAG TPA: PD-(D/E)XK nuclease family protein [Methanoregulaceae archaeon]|nr:PD-(D/E)XK nuclease family protein [Methanoregulaceae archaeon]
MTARCSVIQGLIGDHLEAFISDFQAGSECNPFSTWLILPTERLVQHVRDELSRKDVPFILSRICTMKGFCRSYFEEHRTTTRELTEAESRLLLTQILSDNREVLPLFFVRDRPLPGTIENLQEFIRVITARNVTFPECLGDLQGEKSEQIARIISAYRNRLKELDLVDPDTLIEWTILHLGKEGATPHRQIFVYGLFRPLPLEEDLLSQLRERSESFTCFIPSGADPTIFAGPEKWTGIGDTGSLFQLPSSIPSLLSGIFSSTEPIDIGESIRLDTFPSHSAELQAIAGEICRLHEAGVSLSDISVAFPELQDELDRIGEIFSDFKIPWKSRVTPRLSRFPVIRFLVGIIGLVVNRYSREEVISFLNSPYLHGPSRKGFLLLDPSEVDLVSRYACIESGMNEWQDRLEYLASSIANGSERRFHGISQDSVHRVRDGILRLFDALQGLEGRRSMQDFVREYRGFLDRYHLPNLPSASGSQERFSDEHRVFGIFQKRLDALSRSPLFPEEWRGTTDEFFRIVNTLADEPDQDPDPDGGGVSVIGIREAIHLHLPVLFLCRLVEGVVPRLTTRLPFTNSLENARMGTRSLAEILHEQEYYFIAALLSSQRIYLSAPLADGTNPLLTSAFFERVRMVCHPMGWNSTGQDAERCSRSLAAVTAGERIAEGQVCQALDHLDPLLSIDDLVARINTERYYRKGTCDSIYEGMLSADETIAAALEERFSPDGVYSATSLETYAQCPFRFFLGNVLRLEDLPDGDQNLSPADRGSAVHDILSTFYRRWLAAGRGNITPASIEAATSLMQEIAREELDRHHFESPLWEATCLQMKGSPHAGPGYLERFLTKEAEAEDSPLAPCHFEFSFGMDPSGTDDPASVEEAVALTSSDGCEQLRIRGRIDRIDISPEGLFLIYDYKTGRGHPKIKDIEEGKALQLPLYLRAFEALSEKRGVAAGYYQIRKEVRRDLLLCDEQARCLVASRTKVTPDVASLITRSCDFAIGYIRRIREGAFPLPAEEHCPNSYCEFRRICRFDPYRVSDLGEES